MASLESGRISALKIDERKRRLESSVVPKIRKVFRDMANDAEMLYRTTGKIPTQELSNNYIPEFLSQIRIAMRRSIKEFGFDLRINLEEKHAILFDAQYKRGFFDYEIKETISISDINLSSKVNTINSNFFRESAFFVANQSEIQNQYVTDTNVKEMLDAMEREEIAFAKNIEEQAQNINKLTNEELISIGSQRRKLRRQIESATRQLAASNANKDEIIAKNIKTNLLARSQSRSDLIASQNIGLAESWSRQTEAQLIQDADLTTAAGQNVNVVKEWIAILDSKTRSNHAQADGQIVPVNESFSVGGESLRYPRDPNGSAGNIINCRCVSNNQIEVSQ